MPFGGTVQAKMMLGPAQDRYEREADRAAAHVVGNRTGIPSLSALPMQAANQSGLAGGGGVAQRACEDCSSSDEDQVRIQRKCACGVGAGEPCSCRKEEDEHPEMQIDRLKKDGGGRSKDPLGAVDTVVRSPGKPLPDPVRNDMEQGFGRSFGHVRVHDNPRASASAEAIGAHAYTVGNHIAFNRGKYQPNTDSGRFLLAHELAHTVQQSGAPKPETSRVSQPGDAHQAQKRSDEAFGLPQWEVENHLQGERSVDRKVGVALLPTGAPVAWRCPRRGRVLAEPHRDVSSAPEALLELPPVPDPVLRL